MQLKFLLKKIEILHESSKCHQSKIDKQKSNGLKSPMPYYQR
jgi:hypothetical protein